MAGKLIRVTCLAVLAVAVSAPVSSAKRYDPPSDLSGQHGIAFAVANAVYVLGCKNGTIPGPTGGDNKNYDYYGNPCRRTRAGK